MTLTAPIIVEERIADQSTATLALEVPRDLEYFRGHFPNRPILAGVVQIKWAIELAERCLGSGRNLAGLEALKFRNVVYPGDRLSLSLHYDASSRKLHFQYESDRGVHSSGRLLLQQ